MGRTSKRFLGALLCAALVCSLLPAAARAASNPDIFYFDISEGNIVIAAGSTSGLKITYGSDSAVLDNVPLGTVVTIIGSTAAHGIRVESGVAANITLSGVSITPDRKGAGRLSALDILSGASVKLYLDGENTLQSSGASAGLNCPSGASVTIADGDAAGIGSLTALGGNNENNDLQGAGIGGGGIGIGGGAVTINSGKIIAAGGFFGAGIGGALNATGGGVTINGGSVTATGGSGGGSGIGGGAGGGAGGAVTVNGGSVAATGGGGGSGIGGGRGGSGGSGGSGGDVTINGGSVVATGGSGIGGGLGGMDGTDGAPGSCVITGGSVKVSSMGPAPTNGTAGGSAAVSPTTVTLEDISAVTAVTGLDVSGLTYTYGTNDLYTDAAGALYLWLPAGASVTGTETAAHAYAGSVLAGGTGTLYVPFDYVDENGARQSTGGTLVTPITADTASLTSGWYIVEGDVTLTTTSFTVTGDVYLILADGGSLTASGGGTWNAGVGLESGNSLTIYGQAAGTGALRATGGSGGGAGIGGAGGAGGTGGGYGGDGGAGESAGTVAINGGRISAAGGKDGAAGIGGGSGGAGGGNHSGDGGDGGSGGGGGTVTIGGGTVSAGSIGGGVGGDGGDSNSDGDSDDDVGGDGGDGGSGGGGGTVTIGGGTVSADFIGGGGGGDDGSSNSGYPGDAGYSGSDGSCVITGGSVKVSSMGPAPTNGTAGGSAPVARTPVSLYGVEAVTAVTSLAENGLSYTYGTNDLYTDAAGALYLWLPAGASVTGAVTAAHTYTGSVLAGGTGTLTYDATAPTVMGVTPSGTGAEVAGSVAVTFSEAMDTAAGTVSLSGTALTGGTWSSGNTVFTVPYSGLSYKTAYTVTVSGFKDAAGNSMAADGNHAFTTRSSSGGGSSGGEAYRATVTGSDGSSSSLNITVSGGKATAGLTSEQSALVREGGDLSLTLPVIAGTQYYRAELEAGALSSDGQGLLTINTEFGSVALPSDMLTGTDAASGGTARVEIGSVDSSELPDGAAKAVNGRPVVSLSLYIDGKQTDWSNPGAPVTVSIPYTPADGEDINAVIVWYIDGDGNLNCVTNGRYDPETGAVVFEATHFSLYAVGYNGAGFADVADTAWYHDAVTWLAAREITSGTSATTFSPDAALTRGQFITLLLKAYGVEAVDSAEDNFSDAGDTYYTGYLASAKALGISNGVGGNRFAPEAGVTRQEMFTLLYNALNILGQLPEGDSGKTLSDFTDSGSVASYAQGAMAYLVENGIVSGNNGALLPNATTTRAEMAQVLYILLSE